MMQICVSRWRTNAYIGRVIVDNMADNMECVFYENSMQIWFREKWGETMPVTILEDARCGIKLRCKGKLLSVSCDAHDSSHEFPDMTHKSRFTSSKYRLAESSD